MSLIRPMFVFLFLIFCITASAQTEQHVPDTPFVQKDTAYWVYNFRQFRDAVYQNNREKAKVFADLPIKDENNDIWYLSGGSWEAKEKLGSKVKPFTETDFVKCFNRLFPKEFINCLLKIKTDELYKTGGYRTQIIEDSLALKRYSMDVTYDESDNTLTLSLITITVYKEEDNQVGEFAIMYHFEITKKGHIKLKGIGLAG